MVLNWADWVILSIFVVSCLFGLMRGLVKEALSLANWGIALLIAVTFRDKLASLLINQIETHSLRQLVSFSLLFLASFLIGSLIIYLAGALVKMSGLSLMDRILGMAFGLVRGLIVVMAILILIPPIIAIDHDKWWADSFLIHRLIALESWAREIASVISDWSAKLFG